MESGVACGIKTGLAQYRLSLNFPSVMDEHTGANRTPVRFHADEPNFRPVVMVAQIVAKQGRRFAAINDQNVQVTVVVEVAEGTAAAGMQSRDTGSTS